MPSAESSPRDSAWAFAVVRLSRSVEDSTPRRRHTECAYYYVVENRTLGFAGGASADSSAAATMPSSSAR